jgi:hypothetical protein
MRRRDAWSRVTTKTPYGSLTVHGETARHYRYFDCTAMAEALYRWTAETVRKELKSELDFKLGS